RNYNAPRGMQGEGAKKTGKSGEDIVISVPPGTLVEDIDSGVVVADLVDAGDSVVVARGGDGGRGNFTFRSSTNQAPQKATSGRSGEERRLRLTLKLIADVGLVGLPNAGKSTLLAAVSAAKPLIAEYPFSTLTPNLAIVRIDESASFCMVDIPGLIEGAHEGKGLGLQFLQHIERCRVLLFILDISGDPGPQEAYDQLLHEIGSYSPGLQGLPRMIALNKTDLVENGDTSGGFRPSGGESVMRISAATGAGLPELLAGLYGRIMELDAEEKKPDQEPPYDPFGD
ncbi:MAG TPA: GTPase ObgE, partial [Candidatus Krumholzibacterium sp.]|nr:GTPase ObgE [Candidatus Krumholzibacterium sp.]